MHGPRPPREVHGCLDVDHDLGQRESDEGDLSRRQRLDEQPGTEMEWRYGHSRPNRKTIGRNVMPFSVCSGPSDSKPKRR